MAPIDSPGAVRLSPAVAPSSSPSVSGRTSRPRVAVRASSSSRSSWSASGSPDVSCDPGASSWRRSRNAPGSRGRARGAGPPGRRRGTSPDRPGASRRRRPHVERDRRAGRCREARYSRRRSPRDARCDRAHEQGRTGGDGVPPRDAAHRGERLRSRPATKPCEDRRAAGWRARHRPRGRARGGGRNAAPPHRDERLRLPHRAGGVDQQPQAWSLHPRSRASELGPRIPRDRGRGRRHRPGRRTTRRPRPARASRASGAVRGAPSPRVAAISAASTSRRSYPSNRRDCDPGPHRRRSAARSGRSAQDRGDRRRDHGRRRGRGRRARSTSGSLFRPTSC